MTQPTLFDARQEAEQAMEQIAGNTNRQFDADCENAVLTVGRMHRTFTTDDVWEWLEHHPSTVAHDNRAIGPIMSRLHKTGKIRFTNQYRPSRRRHATPIRVWELV
jgi:hypothetical protein